MNKSLAFLFLLLICPALSFSETRDIYYEEASGISYTLRYDFLKKLSSAKAVHSNSSEKVFEKGEWNEDKARFEFFELGEENALLVAKERFKAVEHEGIKIQVRHGIHKVLEFDQVPPAQFLMVSYGVPDSAYSKENMAFSYIRIWAGGHLLKRIRLRHEPGWFHEQVDLGVGSFLNEPYRIAFDIITDASDRYETIYLSAFSVI